MQLPLIACNPPKRQGSQAPGPARKKLKKKKTAATSLPAITAFPVTQFLIWHLLIWGRFVLVLPVVVVVVAGVGGCSLRPKSRKENEHFAFNGSPIGNSFPAASEKGGRQTRYRRCLVFLFIPRCRVNLQRDRPGCRRMPCELLIVFLPLREHSFLSRDGKQWGRDAAPRGVVRTTLATPFYTCSRCQEHTAGFNWHCF